MTTTSNSRLRLLTGPMFAGKTSRLIDLYKENDPTSSMVFKPTKDDRWDGIYTIQTHDGISLPCNPINKPNDIIRHLMNDTQFVFIDEAQFFDHAELTRTVRDLRGYYGLDVTVAGLDLNNQGEQYQYVNSLEQEGNITFREYLFGTCEICQGTSEYTVRKEEFDQNAEVLIGGAEIYSPRCQACFLEHREKLALNG